MIHDGVLELAGGRVQGYGVRISREYDGVLRTVTTVKVHAMLRSNQFRRCAWNKLLVMRCIILPDPGEAG